MSDWDRKDKMQKEEREDSNLDAVTNVDAVPYEDTDNDELNSTLIEGSVSFDEEFETEQMSVPRFEDDEDFGELKTIASSLTSQDSEGLSTMENDPVGIAVSQPDDTKPPRGWSAIAPVVPRPALPNDPTQPSAKKDPLELSNGLQDQETVIDLAAALGMPPEPATKETDQEESKKPKPAPVARPKIDLGQFLDVEEPKKKKKPVPLAVGPDAGAIRDTADAANVLAKVIPYTILSFLVVATLFIGGLMFTDGAPASKHLEMSIVPMGKLGQRRAPTPTKVRLLLTTYPDELLVMYKGEALGRTPLNTELMVQIGESGVCRIESPYFETFAQEVVPDLLGEIHLDIELIPRN